MPKKQIYDKRFLLLMRMEDFNEVSELAELKQCSIQAVLRGAVSREIERSKRERKL